MPRPDTAEVVKLLVELGQRNALRGGNPYRARAYRRAAESLLALSTPLAELIAQDRLREIPGVGEAIAEIIKKLHGTGTHPALETMRQEIPAGVLEMLSVPGLRPEQVLKLHQKLGLASLADLEEATRTDRIRSVKGLGAALQNKILQGLEIRQGGHQRYHMHRAAELLRAAEANLRQSMARIRRIVPAGDFRRGCELVSDLALVVETSSSQKPKVLKPSTQLSVHLADRARFGATLLCATGSASHVAALQVRARQRGLALSADGLRSGKKRIAGATEAEIYAALDLPFIEPELREGGDEVSRAEEGTLPQLVRDEDVRGLLHVHTDSSDGVHTLEDMAEGTRARGYAYLGIADHSQSAHYAGGLSEQDILAQSDAIDRLNRKFRGKFRVLKGIESDIRADGSLDYPEGLLARFDFVVASVHSRFRIDRETQTQRIIRAVNSPYTTILGHMTGRQLMRRPGYALDIERVLSACARAGVAVEINANPWRLDLDWRWHRRALELGCILSINPDAHSLSELDLTHWGVEMARKGGVSKERVLNCLELPALLSFLKSRRNRQLRPPPADKIARVV
jgi:DNA polymerase (family X)